MCNRYPCDKSLVDLLLLCCCMQQQKGGGLCFVCSMPRPRGDHPHGKPGGRVSMVVNADHMQVTCADHMQVTCRSYAGMQSHASHMQVICRHAITCKSHAGHMPACHHMQVTCMPQFNRLHTSFPFSFSLTDALCFSAADILSSGV